MSDDLRERVARAICNSHGPGGCACKTACVAAFREADAAIAECFCWQPMDTAPRDGTPVILTDGSGIPDVACWEKQYSTMLRGYKEDWWITRDLPFTDPTHWLPLPPAPGVDGEEGSK